MKLTLFFTDGYDWQIKTNRYTIPYFWAKKEPVLVAEYPDFKYWLTSLVKRESRNLLVFRMIKFFPFSRKIFLAERFNLFLNLALLKFIILPFILKTSIEKIWMFYPTVFGLAKLFWPQKKYIYHIVDELSQYRFWYKTKERKKQFKKIEEEVIKNVNLVFTTSATLLKRAKLLNKETFYLENGAYSKKIISVVKNKSKVGTRKYKKPIFGFIGGIDNYRFDNELLRLLADSFKQASFIIIGPVGRGTKLIKRDNIYYLGYMSRKRIANYLNNFSICLMLYSVNLYTKAVFPIKLFEYFALGLPVVTKNLPFTQKYKDLLYIAQTNSDYISLVKKAMKEDNKEKRKKRIKIALEHDWTKIVDKAYNILYEN